MAENQSWGSRTYQNIKRQGTKEEKISTGLVILMLRKYSIFQLFLNCPLTRINFISGIFAISSPANCDICPLLLSLWTLQRSELYVKDSPCETILDLARARASKFPNYEIANLMSASRKSKDSIPTLDLSVSPQLCWGCMATFYKKNAYSKAGSNTIPKNVRMTDKTLSLYDTWQVLHTVVSVVRFMKGKSFLSDPAIKVLNATSPPFPSLSRNIILWSLSCSEQISRSATRVSSLLTTLQLWRKIEMEKYFGALMKANVWTPIKSLWQPVQMFGNSN